MFVSAEIKIRSAHELHRYEQVNQKRERITVETFNSEIQGL